MEERSRIGKAAEASGATPASSTWQGQDLAELAPDEMESLLSDTVLKEFKTRLGRMGIEYQSPDRP